jgi:O-antigen/teichoic acid export membrane protein
MTGISVLVVILTQIDKVILSKMLTLEMFGYYSLAATVASGLYIIISPIFSAIFPHFTQLVSQGDEKELTGIYHKSCQLMSLVIIPISVIITLFAPEILFMWTGDRLIAEKSHLLLSLLVTGTALNALGNIPYALQLAHGYTKLAVYQNLASVIILVPLIFWATNHYGAAGAASIWVILNLGYMFIGIHILHKKFLKQEKMRWYSQDIGMPFLGILLIALPARFFFPEQPPLFLMAAWLAGTFALTSLAACLSIPSARDWMKKVFNL